MKASDLSARAEAGEDAAVLLRELARVVWHPFYTLPVDWKAERFDRHNAFDRLLDINTPEARLAATMMLVLDTMRIGSMGEDGDGDFAANLVSRTVWSHGKSGEGPSLAHSLIAAIARSIDDAT